MRYEAYDKSPEFYCVRGLNKALIHYLLFSVKRSYRYHSDEGWCVHRSQIVNLTQLAYSHFHHIDYSALSNDLQMKIVQERPRWRRIAPGNQSVDLTKPSKAEAYRELYLTPDAPTFVVKAVWRVLAKKFHPDQGGDEEKFKQLKEAYEQVCRQ
jgi:hypothetical protein